MKIMKYFLIAATVVASVSCSKEIAPESNQKNDPSLVTLEFTASADLDEETIGAGENTKVFYDAQTKTTQWKVGDPVKIVASNGNAYDFSVTEVNENGTSAIIKGEVNKSDEESETFYAVYPASAFKGSDLAAPTNETKGARLYIDVPAVQTAVAGTFDPKAFVCIAKSNGNVLEFKNLCSVISFKFNNATDVKSVKFTMVGNTNLASCGNVYVSNLTSHTWGDAFDGRSASNMITLNAPAGGFNADTEYYFTLRPFTQSGDTKGFSFYVEYSDHYKVRPNKTLNLIAARNGIKNLGALDVEGKIAYLPFYDAYNMGFSFDVAGKVINKTTFPSATLITSTTASKDMRKDGLYFIDADATGVTMNSGKSIVAIGNDPGKRSQVSRTNYSYIPCGAANEYWVLSNINLTAQSSNSGYMFQLNGSGVCEEMIINNCSISLPASTSFIFANGSNILQSLIVKDSEFLVGEGNTNTFLNCAATQITDNITFENNVFYSADITKPAASFVLIAATNTTARNLKLHKNTFYGAYQASGSMTNCKITDAIVTKNLFGLRSDATANVFVVGAKISGTQNFSENGYLKNGAGFSVLTVGTSNSAPSGTNSSIGSIGIDTGLWNPAEGKFVLNNGFGATR